ncbi:hypothetical protein [Herbaspirillum sp. alder98]|uniref:hypothetical protein n=1 Tax=Herbaspirillum sp. alder98 TaxID=2913096 RepID=UPI001CD88BFD|nr:hypothetical protein [Herbaspirillum sp. alder98]MCA1322870.1 hypothetical protein [Herbaspirillum sp. alder98]
MRLIIKIVTSKIFILSSILAGLSLPKLSSAATSARLAVSAIVMTRCNIKVINLANGKLDTDNSCSDDTRPTVMFSPAAPPAKKDGADKGRETGTTGGTGSMGGADVTVTY